MTLIGTLLKKSIQDDNYRQKYDLHRLLKKVKKEEKEQTLK